jgi:hypothetical protein
MVNKIRITEKVDPGFDREYREAVERGKERLDQMSKARYARYDKSSKRMVLELQNGVTLFVPIGLIEGLQTDNDAALSKFDLVLDGSQIHWTALDVQFYVDDLLKGVFGTPKWMSGINAHLSEIGRKGGASRSGVKTAASRENGKKGGRPSRKVA